MRYADLPACHRYVFPFIREHLSSQEPAPAYEKEEEGLKELEKVLTFVRSDQYYPTFADKSAYLFCALAGAQHFSNGNKRLAVGVLLLFHVLNQAKIRVLTDHAYRSLVSESFPVHQWEDNPAIPSGTDALFLYNLAIVVGDRKRWGVKEFPELRKAVAMIFGQLYRLDYPSRGTNVKR